MRGRYRDWVTEINCIFCGYFFRITRSNLNFQFSLGLIVKRSAECGMCFLHFLTKTGSYISKKLQLQTCFITWNFSVEFSIFEMLDKLSILKASILFVYFLGYSNLTFIRIRKSCSSNYTVQILSDLGIQISKTICVKIRTFAWKFLSFYPWKIKINAWNFLRKCPWKCQSARENI